MGASIIFFFFLGLLAAERATQLTATVARGASGITDNTLLQLSAGGL
jgi:hypothetical protein